ncbi:MAG: surface antigen, partial [Daejeonella sp.]|nr:surface antigen [Daejeonella sp.]
MTIKGINKEFAEPAANYVQQGIRRNSSLYLALYNTFNTKKGKYRTERIRNIGEAPHILDSLLVEVSRTQIEKFLKSKGYFKATVKSDIRVSKKKAYLTFTAEQGPEFKVNELAYDIPDSTVKNLYLKHKASFSHITPGMRYDSDSLIYEREQIFLLMKGKGYYDYLRQYVRFDVDTNQFASKANLKMYLANPKALAAHQVYTINESFITIKNSDGETAGVKPDTTVLDSGRRFIDYSGRFKPKKLSKYMFIRKNELYNINHENLTYDRLYDLNVFKNLKIDYVKTSDSTNRLNPIYNILPLKKMSNRVEGEYTFNSGRNGFNVGNTFTNRNVFGGSEQLEIKARYGILFDAGVQGKLLDRILSRDLQLGVNLIFPKLLTPFGIIQSGLNGIPHTTISSSFQIYDQRSSFSNRIFVNSITYDWAETKYKQHTFTPINLEFRNGKLDAAFKDTLEANGYNLYVQTNDRQYFNSSSQYSFTFNNIRLNTFANFFYLRLNADAGGNTLGLAKKLLPGKDQSKLFGLSYLQYTKTELDVRLYKHLGGEKQLIVRLNPGVEFPYGNSKIKALPFERQFYAGGSSGVRA